MKKFSIKDLAEIIKAHLEQDTSSACHFTGVSVDSRTIKAGDCFFAIAGDNFDGHDYVAQAFVKGAACAVVSKKIADSKKLNADKILKVGDTIKALGTFAGQYRRRCGMPAKNQLGSGLCQTDSKVSLYFCFRDDSGEFPL